MNNQERNKIRYKLDMIREQVSLVKVNRELIIRGIEFIHDILDADGLRTKRHSYNYMLKRQRDEEEKK